ncbi:hypothetical protein Syun_030091 [Stephania yunnanensis]|uniref:Leucine-rich repeat-containing N-terminal plant-type domain-containing protein n=1 Tax=Stephania yunnanensis TaxID=152371 RepID=A0AAP0EA65_9MAGN
MAMKWWTRAHKRDDEVMRLTMEQKVERWRRKWGEVYTFILRVEHRSEVLLLVSVTDLSDSRSKERRRGNEGSSVLTLLFLCSYNGFSRIHAGSLNDEVLALLSIKSGLIDTSNYLKNRELLVEGWKNKFVHCNWTGVFCNSNCEVEKLDLSHKNLTGDISNDIERLSSLAFFNISHNEFSSSLPKSISNLKFLRQLDVSINYFNGGFPTDLERAVGLTLIVTYNNCFSGSLPGYLGNVTSLEILDLRGRYFEGTIPSSYKNLQKLKFLGLSGNNLTGRIPTMIGQISSLESIFLGYNRFEGEIPREFGDLTNLRYLDLATGSFSVHIPAELGRLQEVQTMLLYNNRLEGEIPPEITNMTSLISLDLSRNRLSGEIPLGISELKNLEVLESDVY